MTTKLLFLLALIMGAASPVCASQFTVTLTAQQDQKPSQAELKEFFDSADDNHAKAFELIQKYGKNIINQHMGFPKSPILINAVDSSWSRAEFECLLGVPEIDINISDGNFTPLTKAMFEAVGGDPSPVKLKKIEMLIEHGVDLNKSNGSGWTPLMKAARYNQPQVTWILLQAGACTDGIIKTGFYARKTFFDFAKENPAVQKIYDLHRIEQAQKKACEAKAVFEQHIVSKGGKEASLTAFATSMAGIIKEYLMPGQEEQ